MAPQLDGRPAEAGFAEPTASPEDVEAYVGQAMNLLTDSISNYRQSR
ncbi:hypothetical protein [Adhaeretor mobilis]|nr:hypothetical protein [Adhaeretor mobilis]